MQKIVVNIIKNFPYGASISANSINTIWWHLKSINSFFMQLPIHFLNTAEPWIFYPDIRWCSKRFSLVICNRVLHCLCLDLWELGRRRLQQETCPGLQEVSDQQQVTQHHHLRRRWVQQQQQQQFPGGWRGQEEEGGGGPHFKICKEKR